MGGLRKKSARLSRQTSASEEHGDGTNGTPLSNTSQQDGAADTKDHLQRHAQSQTPGLGANVAWNYGNTLFVIGLGLVITPYQLARMGLAAYGVVMLQMSLISLATLANSSLVKAAVIEGRSDDARAWRNVKWVSRLSGWCTWGLGLAAAGWLLPLLRIPDELLRDARVLLVIMAISQSLSIFVVVPQARLMLAQRFDRLNKSLIVGQVVQAAGMVLIFESYRPGLLAYGVAVFVGAFASRVLIWRYASGLALNTPVPAEIGLVSTRRSFISMWGALAGQQVCAVFSTQALQLGANLYGGAPANAVMGLLFILRGAVGRLNDGVASAVFAVLATVYPHDEAATRRLWLSATRGVALLALPFVLAMWLMPDTLSMVWLGRNGNTIAAYLPLVAWDIGIPSLALITVQLLQLSHRRLWLLAIDGILFLAIVGGVLLAGAMGVASPGRLFLMYAALRSLYGLVLLGWFGPRTAFTDFASVVRAVIVPVMACALVAAAAIWLVRHVEMGSTPHLRLAYAALAAAVLYLPMVWFYGLEAGLRERITARLSSFGR
jgi:O-antigen/teichoic acid export membrane protein